MLTASTYLLSCCHDFLSNNREILSLLSDGRFFSDLNPLTTEPSPKKCRFRIFSFGACAYGIAIAVPNFFLALFFSFLPAPILSLPSACHILSGCCKKFGVNHGKTWKLARVADGISPASLASATQATVPGNGTLINLV